VNILYRDSSTLCRNPRHLEVPAPGSSCMILVQYRRIEQVLRAFIASAMDLGELSAVHIHPVAHKAGDRPHGTRHHRLHRQQAQGLYPQHIYPSRTTTPRVRRVDLPLSDGAYPAVTVPSGQARKQPPCKSGRRESYRVRKYPAYARCLAYRLLA
jgi:hypothetical protein